MKASNFNMLAQQFFKHCTSQMKHWDGPNLASGPWFGTCAEQRADERGSVAIQRPQVSHHMAHGQEEPSSKLCDNPNCNAMLVSHVRLLFALPLVL